MGMSSCETSHWMDDECTDGVDVCVNNVSYICQNAKYIKKACVSGCGEDGKCLCPNECDGQCSETGKCTRTDCTKGTDETTGKCLCPENCMYGCDNLGNCLAPQDCVNDYDHSTGGCLCAEGCVNGCDVRGVCQCAEGCVNGCDVRGVCQCAEGCVNGCDERGKCRCKKECSDLCRPSGECICELGDAICSGNNEIKKCIEHDWVTNSCPAGCQKKQNEGNHDSCIPFVCSENEVQCNDTEDRVQICHNNTWNEMTELCNYGCLDGECLPAEVIIVSANNVKLLKGRIETFDTIKVEYLINSVAQQTDLTIEYSNAKCVKMDKVEMEDHSYEIKLSIQPEVSQCEAIMTLKAGKAAEKRINIRVYGKDEDNNGNHLNDYYETAQKQGNDCRKYSDCDSNDGNEKGFCDSFIGYKCSTKCTDDSQCVNPDGSQYHYVCRGDGRCAPDAFVVGVVVPPNEPIFLNSLESTQEDKFYVDWGDKNYENYEEYNQENIIKGDISHTYNASSVGNLRIIKIKGIEEKMVITKQIGGGVFYYNIKSIYAFGPVKLRNDAFNYASDELSIDDAIDIPDASQLTDMNSMFKDSSLNPKIGNWDVSNVKNMSKAFWRARNFNQPIGNWDTSNVNNMSGMFMNAKSFNQDIGRWDTSVVIDMSEMFENYETQSGVVEDYAFNQDISQWDVSNVVNMSMMFYNCQKFDQKIGEWNTSRVNNMSGMFQGAISFNQDIGKWNVKKVADMSNMFNGAASFNQELNYWEVDDSVENMSSMFENAISFDSRIADWKLYKVVEITKMFKNAKSFNQDISIWSFNDKLKDMSEMFSGASSFNQNIGGWNVQYVENMSSMFENATSFNQDISSWTINKLDNFYNMFCDSGISFDLLTKIQSEWNKTAKANDASVGDNKFEELVECEYEIIL